MHLTYKMFPSILTIDFARSSFAAHESWKWQFNLYIFFFFCYWLGCLCLDWINNHNIQLRVLAIICNIGRIENSTQLKKNLCLNTCVKECRVRVVFKSRIYFVYIFIGEHFWIVLMESWILWIKKNSCTKLGLIWSYS